VRDATARLEALTADQRRAADHLEQMLHDSVAPRRP
jgi:hypothetical protein